MKFKTWIAETAIIINLLVISNLATAGNKEFPYMKDGISFSLAKGWNVISNDSIGNNAWYFSAERGGPKSTGLITVTWLNKVENPRETIILHQRTMKASNIYRNPGIEFTAVTEDTFATFKVWSCQYTTIVKGEKIEGLIYCFNSSEKTITLFFQSGISDKKMNQKALGLIKITFNCRE
jgi:hypothetical protein